MTEAGPGGRGTGRELAGNGALYRRPARVRRERRGTPRGRGALAPKGRIQLGYRSRQAKPCPPNWGIWDHPVVHLHKRTPIRSRRPAGHLTDRIAPIYAGLRTIPARSSGRPSLGTFRRRRITAKRKRPERSEGGNGSGVERAAALLRSPAAVDREDRARDHARRPGGQEDDCRGDVGSRSDVAHRDAFQDRG